MGIFGSEVHLGQNSCEVAYWLSCLGFRVCACSGCKIAGKTIKSRMYRMHGPSVVNLL